MPIHGNWNMMMKSGTFWREWHTFGTQSCKIENASGSSRRATTIDADWRGKEKKAKKESKSPILQALPLSMLFKPWEPINIYFYPYCILVPLPVLLRVPFMVVSTVQNPFVDNPNISHWVFFPGTSEIHSILWLFPGIVIISNVFQKYQGRKLNVKYLDYRQKDFVRLILP